MKKKLFISIIGIMLISLLGLFSCQEECGPFPNKFKVVALNWCLFKVVYSDTAGSTISFIENDSVPYNQYAIWIFPGQETYFAHNPNIRNFSLIPGAYACSPKEPETDEKIDSIRIESSKDFDVNHPPGSDLSDLFDVEVLDFVNGINYEKFDLQDYVKTNPFVPKEMMLILREQPDATTDYEFTVKYYQNGIDDNDYFEFTTPPIVLITNK